MEETIRPRLMGVHRPGELEKLFDPSKLPPEIKKFVPEPRAPSAVAKVFERKSGYANYYFNRLQRDRLLARLDRPPAGRWRFVGKANGKDVVVTLADKAAAWESGADQFIYLPNEERTLDPPGTNGMLVALWQWRQLLVAGAKGFDDCHYAGAEGAAPLPELIDSRLGAVECRWRFDRAGGLLGVEAQIASQGGPCDLAFSGRLNDASGRLWPSQWIVGVDGKSTLNFDVERAEVAP